VAGSSVDNLATVARAASSAAATDPYHGDILLPKAPVYLLYNPRIAASERLAHELAAVVEQHNYPVVVGESANTDALLAAREPAALLVTLGGDGTILKVARDAANRVGEGVATPPLLTIDFGTVGFLTELPPDRAHEGMRRVLAGDFWLEERHYLRAYLTRDGDCIADKLALNDVVLARGDGPHAIRLVLTIDGAETARYTADGMVVASPTGSTAYALAAGGPVLHPTMNAMMAIPVAPHLAVARGFVVPSDSTITLTASTFRTTVVTLDGQVTIPYSSGDSLTVITSSQTARFVRFGAPTYFYTTLQERLRRN
jgi:NAD+ kinase